MISIVSLDFDGPAEGGVRVEEKSGLVMRDSSIGLLGSDPRRTEGAIGDASIAGINEPLRRPKNREEDEEEGSGESRPISKARDRAAGAGVGVEGPAAEGGNVYEAAGVGDSVKDDKGKTTEDGCLGDGSLISSRWLDLGPKARLVVVKPGANVSGCIVPVVSEK